MIRVLCYALFFACFFSALTYDVLYIPTLDGMIWLYKLKWLTMINMVLQTLYYGACLTRAVVDYFAERPDRGPHTAHPAAPSYYSFTKLHSLCDYLYTRLAFPLSQLVVIMFWGLYVIDRELVYPEYLDKIIPTWVNHVMHTAPVPFILIDSLLICHKYPPRWEGVRAMIGYGILYEISLVVWYLVEDEWAYPVLAFLDNFQRSLFFLGVMIFLIVLYLIGDGFNAVIWGTASHPPEKVEKGAPTSTKPKKMRKDQ